jgi:hypothetical protein
MTDALTNIAAPTTTTTQPATKVPDLNFKEIVTAAIALAIVATLIALLWWGFIKGDTLGDNQKYIIGIVLSLAGTVTGYYFGRVPAEKRADTAERAENEAKDGKAKADAKVADAKQTVERALFGPSASQDSQVLDTTANNSGDAVRQELEALRRRLG